MYIRKLDTTVVRNIEEGAIVVNMTTGEKLTINKTAALFMSVLKGTHTLESLSSQLINYFDDISLTELRQDLFDFFSSMSDEGYLRIGETKEAVGDFPLKNIHIEVTMKCNERCIHCYLPNAVKDEAATMPFTMFQEIVDDFKKLGGEQVSISGGEPLSHPKINEMLRYCADKGLMTNIFSNLTLLRDDTIEILKNMQVGLVQTSVYSLNPNIHDKITKVKGSLQKTLNAINRLSEAGINVQIACPVMRVSKNGVVDMMEYAKSKGISLRMNALIMSKADGDSTAVNKLGLDISEMREMYISLNEADADFTRNNLLELQDNSSQFCSDSASFLCSPLCQAGIDQCCVSSKGEVFPCPDWWSFSFGNLSKHSLTDIWLHSDSLKLLRRINQQKNFPKCLECDKLDFCKRCLLRNSQLSNGELLNTNPIVCKEAALIKNIFS